MEILRTIVLVVALVSLAKAAAMLIVPQTFRRIVEGWVNMPAGLLRAVGWVVIVLGVGCGVLAVIEMRDPVIGAVTVLSALLVIGGALYQFPRLLQTLARPFGDSGRDWVVRVCGLLAFAVSVALLVVFFFSRSGVEG